MGRPPVSVAIVLAFVLILAGRAMALDSVPDGGGFYAPQALAVDTPGNGVLEANETAEMAPTWLNFWNVPANIAGTSAGFTGPAGPLYENPDNTADYAIPIFSSGSCRATGDCYSVRVTDSAATSCGSNTDTFVVCFTEGAAASAS